MNYRFRPFEGTDNQWYITIEHVNGQCLYTSKGYTRKESATWWLERFIRDVRMANPMHDSQALVAQHTISK